MLDCISGGRLVAGFPTGLPTDATISNGVVPVEQRERYREALALVTKAWSAKEIFAWNGKHYQLGMVNLWPRPIQQPHPPIWIPGSGISSTAEYVVGLDHCFCHLSYYGAKNAEHGDRPLLGAGGAARAATTIPTATASCSSSASPRPTPRPRSSTPRTPSISSTSCSTRRRTISRFRAASNIRALVQALQNNPRGGINLRELKAKDFFDRGFVIVGSPKTVREQLMDGMKRLRIGHLLALLHFGSMPTELCKHNIDLFAREVLPHLEGLWDDEYEDRWWPERLRAKRPAAAMAARPESGRRADMAAPEVRRLRLWQDRIETEVEIAGSGPPLVYLHGPWGLAPDRAFVARLADAQHGLCAAHPGTTPGDPEAVHALDSWLDLVVYYGELLDRLELDAPALVGHSFGGLVAAEIAAAAPKSVGRLVLIDPVGLWRDDLPVKNWMMLSDSERRPSLFADPDGEAAQQFFAVPSDPAERVDTLAQFIWAQACTGKFVWPIPDRGLKNRMHRIAAPTLIVWGKADRIIAPGLRAGIRHADRRRARSN